MGPRKFKPLDVDGIASFTPSASHATSQLPSQVSSQLPSGSSTPSSTGGTISMKDVAAALGKLQESPLTPDFTAIAGATDNAASQAAIASAVAKLSEDPLRLEEWNVLAGLQALMKLKKNSVAREGAFQLITSVANTLGSNIKSHPYLLQLLPFVFDAFVDKDASVKRSATGSQHALQASFSPEVLASAFLNVIWDYLDSGAKWQGKIAALDSVDFVLGHVPEDYIDQQFVRGIPALTNQLHDFKPEVSKLGDRVLRRFMGKLDNHDVSPRIDVIIEALADPRKVTDCIKVLSAVTFVAEVTESCLAVLVPILSRALGVFSSQDSLRQTVTVTENLTRLVHNPCEITRYIPELKPGVSQTVQTAAQPEVRELAAKALKVLEDAEKETAEPSSISLAKAEEVVPKGFANSNFAARVIQLCVNCREFSKLDELLKNLCDLDKETAHQITVKFENMFADSRVPEDDQDGIEVVNAKFSLAYGGRMLLNKAILRLMKGHRYGVCGRNGCGKSTLMRSISLGKLEGFPDKSEVRTCFVEHKLQGADASTDLVSFIAMDEEIEASKEEIASALAEVGFDEERRQQHVGALSGGWKMKLELARAMLMKADILLLDEPTNHLDVGNVAWLANYLNTHPNITSLIISHDSGFLDEVCTDIIHYESKRLVYYKGNLSEFVKVRPEGKAYYTLTDSNVQMHFPPPGILTGVRSNTRAIARMSRVSFAYPGAAKNSLSDLSCSVSLSSRVAILGPNGAGKSTLIKLLTGELVGTEGTVEKHPNLRIGYIAQHALQHVEQHKEKTPSQYLQWRYRNGDDREVHMKQSRQMSQEEKDAISKPQDLGDGGRPRVLEAIIGRQKLKKSFQYEVQWIGFLPKFNSWLSREEMIERGFGKLVQAFDDHEASREGLGYRELQPPIIRKHFEDVGLDGDIADHTPMGSLSGGQLVKVVIAGATWNNPHLLVLDEPTNYLDRDSLGGLAVAIREWSGGVLLISHNEEFVGALCPEQWIIQDGRMITRGKVEVASDRFETPTPGESAPSSTVPSSSTSAVGSAAASDADTNADSPLNIKIRQKKKKLTRNQIKEREVRRRLRYLEWLNSPKGTPKPEDTDSE